MRMAIVFISIIVVLISCDKSKKQRQFVNLSENFSKSTFIKKNDASELNYAEIEFREDNTLVILSEMKGQVGPFKFMESENMLTFNNLKFDIIPNSDGSLTLKNNKEEFILYKIPFNEKSINKNQIDPFYLRRCYYLVHLNLISTDDAIKYLFNTFTVPIDSIPEEEIIFTN